MSPRLNTLLASLPETEYQALARHLQLISLQKGQVLFRAGEVPSQVYYPIGAIVSGMLDSGDGQPIETFMLGKTCMVGIAALGQPSFYLARVRSSGLAYRMSMEAFLRVRSECPTYIQGAHAATNRMLMQLSQSIVCSKRHSVEQQLIRWMLITLDRTLDSHIHITHQELSEILGFRREAITMNLGKMTDRGDIHVRRGVVEILSREALEERSCTCYWIGQQQLRPAFQQLAGFA